MGNMHQEYAQHRQGIFKNFNVLTQLFSCFIISIHVFYSILLNVMFCRSTDPRVMPKNPTDPHQTTDVQELLESSEAFNPNVGVTIAPMSDTHTMPAPTHTHRRQPSNISKT